ncbi:Transcription repressor NadR [Moorella glycerini]|uniref:Transcription repressor NiaR n=1 Tax=Neomoorella stamsii TaxID=1266720 RepID=A0A9X7P7D2_9FIRM|nr:MULTISPECIES: transcription repressor NadR [Moorella]PRR76917.1 putative transcription repressor NiaR [Moorella stamsii]CEP68549.1 Transcription repressor NadR [Moorella glycerini]
MKASERRQRIIELLDNNQPRKGTELAALLGVSRQVIVQDVAVLRAAGVNILATPQGYLLPGPDTRCRRTFACQHDLAGLERELQIMVDYGGKVIDVVVEHPLYGEIRGYLMLASRYDVQKFVADLKASGAKPLYTLTGSGVHLHTVEAAREDILDIIAAHLAKAGFLLE